jgi:hypothetical protein
MGSIMSDIMKVAQLAMDVATQNWVAVAEDVFKDIAQLTGNKTLEEIAAALPPVGLLESPMMSGLMQNAIGTNFNAMNLSLSNSLGMASSPAQIAAAAGNFSFGTNPLQYLQVGSQATGYAGTLSGNQNLAGVGMLGNLAASNPLVQNAILQSQVNSVLNQTTIPNTVSLNSAPQLASLPVSSNTNLLSLTPQVTDPNAPYSITVDGGAAPQVPYYVAPLPSTLTPDAGTTVAPTLGAPASTDYSQLNSQEAILNVVNTGAPLTPAQQQQLLAAGSAAGMTPNQLQTLQGRMAANVISPGSGANVLNQSVGTVSPGNAVLNAAISNGAFSTQLSPSQLQMLNLAQGTGNYAPVYSAVAANGLPSYLQSAPSWQQNLYGVGSVLAAYGQSMPGLQARMPIMASQGSYISQGLSSGAYATPTYANPYGTPTIVPGQGMSSGGGYVAPTYSSYSPSVAQYGGGGGNAVINQGVASGAFSTALTTDQNNMLSQAAAAGASSSQIAMMRLQMEMENQQEVLQAISKIFNMLDQTAKAIIQNM